MTTWCDTINKRRLYQWKKSKLSKWKLSKFEHVDFIPMFKQKGGGVTFRNYYKCDLKRRIFLSFLKLYWSTFNLHVNILEAIDYIHWLRICFIDSYIWYNIDKNYHKCIRYCIGSITWFVRFFFSKFERLFKKKIYNSIIQSIAHLELWLFPIFLAICGFHAKRTWGRASSWWEIIASCLVAYSGRFSAIALFKRINCIR